MVLVQWGITISLASSTFVISFLGLPRLPFHFRMPVGVVRFHCPFVGFNGCQDEGGSGLTKSSSITHLHDCHCRGDAQVVTRHSLTSDLAIFSEAELTFRLMGIWLCGVCFKMHSLRSKCRHGQGSDFVAPLDVGDGVVWFVLYGLTKQQFNYDVLILVDSVVQGLSLSLTYFFSNDFAL